jgi:transcriptional regulator with XRE-family HTH domain
MTMVETKTAADYLVGIFNERKDKNPRYSLRAFARSLGVSSGQLSEILSSKRPLSHKLGRRIAIAMALTEEESQKLNTLISQQTQFMEIAGPNSRQLSDEEIALLAITQNLDTPQKPVIEFDATSEANNFLQLDQEIVMEVKKTIRNFRRKLKKVLEHNERRSMDLLSTDKAV